MEGDVWESLCWRLQKAAFLQSSRLGHMGRGTIRALHTSSMACPWDSPWPAPSPTTAPGPQSCLPRASPCLAPTPAPASSWPAMVVPVKFTNRTFYHRDPLWLWLPPVWLVPRPSHKPCQGQQPLRPHTACPLDAATCAHSHSSSTCPTKAILAQPAHQTQYNPLLRRLQLQRHPAVQLTEGGSHTGPSFKTRRGCCFT